MTKIEQRIFIAEADGWFNIENSSKNNPWGWLNDVEMPGDMPTYAIIPNYLNNRDVIIDVIIRRMKDKQVEFINNLRVVTEYKESLKTVHWFAVVTASAEDLCKAFIVTHTGKWF